MIGAVVLAGGQGKRMQAGINKQYLEIEGRSVLSLAIESMAAVADGLIVVCAHGEEAQARAAVRESGAIAERVQIVEGGKERQDSVRNALLAMPESWQKVLIHDGARPFVPQEMLRRILDATGARRRCGAGNACHRHDQARGCRGLYCGDAAAGNFARSADAAVLMAAEIPCAASGDGRKRPHFYGRCHALRGWRKTRAHGGRQQPEPQAHGAGGPLLGDRNETCMGG